MKQITFKYQEDCVIQQPRCQAIAALLGQMLHGPGAEWTKTCKSYIGASKKYASETCDCICDYLPYNVHSKRFIALYTMILSCLSLKLSSSLSTWYLASALQGWSRSGILYLQSSIVLKRLEDSDIKSTVSGCCMYFQFFVFDLFIWFFEVRWWYYYLLTRFVLFLLTIYDHCNSIIKWWGNMKFMIRNYYFCSCFWGYIINGQHVMFIEGLFGVCDRVG